MPEIKCEFSRGAPIQASQYFVGRREELNFLTDAMSGIAPTSVNVYGERRIGKSSLLKHFSRTWGERVASAQRTKFVVVYLELESCYQKAGFYQQIATKLCECPQVIHSSALRESWQTTAWTAEQFTEALDAWHKQKILPVVCLDNMDEALRGNVFDANFYAHLRHLMGECLLMLIVASFKPLLDKVYKKEYGLSSLFFNQGQDLALRRFTAQDTETLLRIADSLGLSEQNQQLMQVWGENHPLRLQIAGYYLCQAQRDFKSVAWAKQQFEKQIESRLPRKTLLSSQRIGNIVIKAEQWIREVSNLLGNLRNYIGVVLVVAIVILVALGIIPIKWLIIAVVTIFGLIGVSPE